MLDFKEEILYCSFCSVQYIFHNFNQRMHKITHLTPNNIFKNNEVLQIETLFSNCF